MAHFGEECKANVPKEATVIGWTVPKRDMP